MSKIGFETFKPKGWEMSSLDEIAEINKRLTFDHLDDNSYVSFVPMQCLEAETGKINLTEVRKQGEVRKGYKQFIDGDILFARITPCMENGKIAIAKNLKNGVGYGSTEYVVIRCSPRILNKYIFYYLLQNRIRNYAKHNMKGTAGQLRVPTDFVMKFQIPYPNLDLQELIIERIEGFFTKLDAGIHALEQSQLQLEQYRQSLLKAAVEGDLTKKWRDAHIDEMEPASVLLDRILVERRKRWEDAYLADCRAKGKVPKDENWKKKYIKPAKLDSDLPELPDNWIWVSLDQIISYIRNGLGGKAQKDEPGMPIITVSAVRAMSVEFSNYKYYRAEPIKKIRLFLLKEGDLLFTRYNGTKMYCGVCGLIKKLKQEIVHSDKLICVRLALFDWILLNYIEIAVNVGFTRDYINNKIKTTAGQHGISGTDLKSVPIPLPPLAEQEEIITIIGEKLSVQKETKNYVEKGLKCTNNLRNSILTEAFRGKLIEKLELNQKTKTKRNLDRFL